MKSAFEEHIYNEIEKYRGVSFPVKTGMLWRLLIKKVDCNKIHPNPEDEFSMPKVGPSFKIISEYESAFRRNEQLNMESTEEPLIVEKMYPDGYMIINGHHRWAAYYRLGRKKVPVSIVNLAHGDDIKQMLDKGSGDKRVTLDLDEVVFCEREDEAAEKKPGFPFGKLYKERIRLGIPALFNFLSKKGYDIWVYSSKFYSMDYIRSYLEKYHVNITGIVTGTSKKSISDLKDKKEIDSLIARKYKHTLHIDNEMVLKIRSGTGEFEEYPIEKDKDNWSQGIMNTFKKMEANEEKS